MDRKADGEGSGSRFASYVEHIASTLGHADRRTPFRSSCAGLILLLCGAHSSGDRKSVEPIAARIEPAASRARISRCTILSPTPTGRRRICRGGFEPLSFPPSRRAGLKRLDGRRPGIPQEGRSFGGGRAAILRSAWQAGQLSGRGLAVGPERACKPADRLSALSSRGLGHQARFAEQRLACPRTSCSRPNRKSPLTGSGRARRRRAGGRRAGVTPVTGSTRRSERR